MAQRNAPLRLRFAEGELTVSAQSQDVGETRESLPAAYTAEPLEIGFNADFLREGLESVDADTVQLKLINPLRPGLISRRRRRLLVPDHAHPARRLIVRHARLRDVPLLRPARARARARARPRDRPERRGKTNLVEAIHLAAQGFSFRTRADAQIVRHGGSVGVSTSDGDNGGASISLEAHVGVDSPKRLLAQRLARPLRRGAPPAHPHAGLHPRSARRRQGRAGRATRLPRPLPRASAPRPGRHPRRLRRCARSAQRVPAPRRCGLVHERRPGAVDGGRGRRGDRAQRSHGS